MLDHTKAALEKTKRDIDIFYRVFSLITQSVYIAYLAVMLATGTSTWAVNLVLLTLSIAYLVFFIITETCLSRTDPSRVSSRAVRSELRRRRTTVRRMYVYTKYALMSVTLGVAIFDIWVRPEAYHPLMMFWTMFMAMLLMIKVIIEVIRYFVRIRIDLFKAALISDAEAMTAPIRNAADGIRETIHRFSGARDRSSSGTDNESRGGFSALVSRGARFAGGFFSKRRKHTDDSEAERSDDTYTTV